MGFNSGFKGLKIYMIYWHVKMKYIRVYSNVHYSTHKYVSLVSVTSLFHLHHIFSVSLSLALAFPKTGVRFISLPIKS